MEAKQKQAVSKLYMWLGKLTLKSLTFYLKGVLEVRVTTRPINERMGQTVHFLFPQERIKNGILSEVPSIKSQIISLTLVEGVGRRMRSLQKGIRDTFISR